MRAQNLLRTCCLDLPEEVLVVTDLRNALLKHGHTVVREPLPARSAVNEPDKEYAAAPSAGLQSQDMDAVAIRTHWSMDVVQASRGRYHRTGMAALAICTHWSHGRYHRTGMDAHSQVRFKNVRPRRGSRPAHVPRRVLCCGVTSGLRAKP